MVQELDSGKLMFSGGNNDECYTPDYGVKPILKYIPEGAIVWCPFDTIDSEFTKQISKQNKVIAEKLKCVIVCKPCHEKIHNPPNIITVGHYPFHTP